MKKQPVVQSIVNKGHLVTENRQSKKKLPNSKPWGFRLIPAAVLVASTMTSAQNREPVESANSDQLVQSENLYPGCLIVSEPDTTIRGEAYIQSRSDPSRVFVLEQLTGEAIWCKNSITIQGTGHRSDDPAFRYSWSISYVTESDELEFSFEDDRKIWLPGATNGGIQVEFRPEDYHFMAQYLNAQVMEHYVLAPGSVFRVSK